MINPIQNHTYLSKEDRLDFRSLEEAFPFVIVNAAIAGLIFQRSLPLWVRISIITAFTTAFSLTGATVGEKNTFEQNLQRQDYLGYFLREKYSGSMKITNKFPHLDREFEKVYV